nr:ribonuclease H-like domain-containing protein [Tanacetum cinerariifolium]
MHDEYNALVKSGTWILIPRPAGINLVRSIWLFKHKFHADGTLSRYKARLVANGSSQQLDIDCDETFSPVVKPATIRTVLSLAVSRKWPIHQLDVKNDFLNGDLSKNVYMHQPPGFVDPQYPHHVCLLQKSLYGYATRVGFYLSRCDSSLFIIRQGSQDAIELFARAHKTNCNHSRTPVDTDSKLGPEGVPVQDPTLYRSLAGGLQYLTFTRPNISYAVQHICLYMHDPREPHLAALKRILRYIRGTLDFGFHLYSSTTISLVGYTDADWAGCPSTRRSTSGYCVFLGDNLLSWSSKRQRTISRSSAEAEYRGVANVVAEMHGYATFFKSYTLYYPLQLLSTVTIYQSADIFTKGLPLALFEDFRGLTSFRSFFIMVISMDILFSPEESPSTLMAWNTIGGVELSAFMVFGAKKGDGCGLCV